MNEDITIKERSSDSSKVTLICVVLSLVIPAILPQLYRKKQSKVY